MIEIKIHCLAASPECGEWHGAKPCRMIPFRITPGGWAGKVLETPPSVEFSSIWVGGWEGPNAYYFQIIFSLGLMEI
jgi:hypothetical protein